MTTADRVLAVLQLFTTTEPEWTVENAAQRLQIPTSTAYRYFRSLTEAGLIVAFAAGRYVIGPAIIELDRQARHYDPLIQAARPAMSQLAMSLRGQGVSLLCRIYRRTVICVDQASEGLAPFAISYERGRPMPLFRGAASKAITANLSARTLRRYFDAEIDAVREAGLSDDWDVFRATMREIRKAGVHVTSGELDPGLLGISAPVFAPDGEILASIGIVAVRAQVEPDLERKFVERVRRAGKEVTGALAAHAAEAAAAGQPTRESGRAVAGR